MRTVTVISPVYNEEAVIAKFYDELRKVATNLRDRYRINFLFVVDRSTDSTLNILRKIASQDPSVRVVALSSRFGHQMALLAGIDNSDADAIIMMDSDLQHPPELIPKLLKAFELGNDVVYTIRMDREQVGFIRRNVGKLFYRLLNVISDVPISENAADFRLISSNVARVFRDQIRERNQFIRGLVSWVGFSTIGIEFDAGHRAAGESKYSLGRMLRFALHGIVSFSKKPLQAAIVVGFVFAFAGLIITVLTVIQYFVYETLPPGWTTITILLSMFSGVQLIFIGIIGEYIGAIFDEVKARPHYIVEERINFS